MLKALSSAVNVVRFILNHPLNRENRSRALLKLFRWQLASRIVACSALVDWIDNVKIIFGRGDAGITGNFYCGLMEFEDMCFLLHYLRETDDFFDVGANAGAYTLLASGVVGARSFAFEPIPATFDKIRRHAAINGISELVTLENRGIGARSETLDFTNNLDCMNRVNDDPTNKSVTRVSVIALDEYGIPSTLTLVKIDVEGYEKYVLEGGKRFFSDKNIDAIIIETNQSGLKFGFNDAFLDKTIKSFGFTPVSYDPLSRTLHQRDTCNPKGNTIYVRNIETALSRCQQSKKFKIHTAFGIEI
jgi:FkbM family methyltransferase